MFVNLKNSRKSCVGVLDGDSVINWVAQSLISLTFTTQFKEDGPVASKVVWISLGMIMEK